MPFHSRRHSIQERGMDMQDLSLYRSMIIDYTLAIGIENSGDVYNKVEPFLHHLASKHIAAEHEGYTYIGSLFDIGIMYDYGDDDREYKRLVSINIEPHGDVFEFSGPGPNFIECDLYGTYTYPIEIHIDAYGCCLEEVAEEYYESEHESEDESITLKSYKEDKCVVCLNNEPEILFYDCAHYCVCHECEKRKPFKKCPCCRTRILTKIII